MSGRWVIALGESGWPTPIPDSTIGGCRMSAARSAPLTTTAAPPSLSRQQSSNRNGSAIIRDAWWSATVIGVRIKALSFSAAWRRMVSATSANCSLVVP